MVLPMKNQRGPSVTIIAAISEQEGLIHYKFVRGSNNGQVFLAFLKEL
jgi:hypothetical protein